MLTLKTEQLNTNPLYCAALKAINLLEDAQYECFLVGGFVHDALLDRPISDVDLATDAPYHSFTALFKEAGFAVHETGAKHGTATVIVDGFPIEITQYRSDGVYTDHRHPQRLLL